MGNEADFPPRGYFLSASTWGVAHTLGGQPSPEVGPQSFMGRGRQANYVPSAVARGLAASREWHAGASTSPHPAQQSGRAPSATGAEAALRDVVRELNRSNRHQEDSAGASKGTLSSIGREEGQLVYLARACDHLTVTLCPNTVEKEAFHALRSAGQNMRPLLRSVKFPVNITNAIAYGFAAFQHGGRCHESLPEHALSSANYPHTSEQDMDNFVPPKDYKLESRPRHATTLSLWFRDALRECWVWACFYGQEHYVEQERALQFLLDLGEKHDYAWPASVILRIWCELRGRWCEELRMTRQKLMEVVGDESPSYERIRFICCTPMEDGSCWLQLPRTYDLEDDSQYFHTDIRVRHEALLTRSNWAMAFSSQKVQAPRQGGGGKSGKPDESAKSGTPPDVAQSPSSSSPPRCLGKPLSRVENGRALDHRPRSPGGRFICWDHSTHLGCSRKDCFHSHKQLAKPHTLDRSVQMQLARRGGHTETKRVTTDQEADQRVEQLRQAHEKEEQSKRKAAGEEAPKSA